MKQGLLGDYRFHGKEGALDYIRQTGCLQFDPVDSCGKNAELALQSRVKGFRKSQLFELLYRDRSLVDYPDKNLSIIPVEYWPYFERYREAARVGGRQFPELARLEEMAKSCMAKNGAVRSDELPIEGEINWHSSIHWSGNWHKQSAAARSVLEQLYSTGEVVIHHKEGTRKFYDLAEKHIPAEILSAPEPLPDEQEHINWRVLRRIGAVGMLANRPSDAWLNIWGMKTDQRARAFAELLERGDIMPVSIEGVKGELYIKGEDMPLIAAATSDEEYKARCELIAPLDCMMWDRKLIRALFGYHYSWEIYTPADKRVYGSYVLPLLYGERFVGRVEPIADRKTGELIVKNVWYEDGVKRTKRLSDALESSLKRFAKFNDCGKVVRKDMESCAAAGNCHGD